MEICITPCGTLEDSERRTLQCLGADLQGAGRWACFQEGLWADREADTGN